MSWEQQCVDIFQIPCFGVGDPEVETCHDPIKIGEDCTLVWVDDPEDPEPGDPCDDPENFWFCNPEGL